MVAFVGESRNRRFEHEGFVHCYTGYCATEVRSPVMSHRDNPVASKSIGGCELNLEPPLLIRRQGRHPDGTRIEVPARPFSVEEVHHVSASTNKESLVEGMPLPGIFGEDFAKGRPGLSAEATGRVKMAYWVGIDVASYCESPLILGINSDLGTSNWVSFTIADKSLDGDLVPGTVGAFLSLETNIETLSDDFDSQFTVAETQNRLLVLPEVIPCSFNDEDGNERIGGILMSEGHLHYWILRSKLRDDVSVDTFALQSDEGCAFDGGLDKDASSLARLVEFLLRDEFDEHSILISPRVFF